MRRINSSRKARQGLCAVRARACHLRCHQRVQGTLTNAGAAAGAGAGHPQARNGCCCLRRCSCRITCPHATQVHGCKALAI